MGEKRYIIDFILIYYKTEASTLLYDTKAWEIQLNMMLPPILKCNLMKLLM